MLTYILTRRSDNKELDRKRITDNWWGVYQDRARFEGRRMYRLSQNAFEVIFTEKNCTVTLIKED